MDKDKENFNGEGEENDDYNTTDEQGIEESQGIKNESSIEGEESIKTKDEDISIDDENLKDNKEEVIENEGYEDNEESLKDNPDRNDSEKEVKIEDNDIERRHTKNKKIVMIIGSIIGLIIVGIIIIKTTVSKYDSVVYPGVFIYGEDVAGLNKNDLNKRIDEFKNKINEKKVNINANGNAYDLKMKDIVLNYNEDKLSYKILNNNKDKNIFRKYILILTKQKQEYKLEIDLKENVLKEKAQKIAKDTDKKCEEAKIIINGNNIKYEDGKKGTKLDTKSFLSTIEKCVKGNNIYKEDIKINGEYIDDNPKINKENLKKVNYKIATYSTTYVPGGGRGSNVETAAKKIDDLLLMPGDEFSYEQSVGPVTQENGYTYAPVISDGELVQGIGGGVCQVSSTLYNTQLKSGILPTERRNHSHPVSYVPRGLDATLASGSIDYKFKNTHEYPIVINTYTGGGKLTIEFWSNEHALKGIEYKPVGYASGKTANSYLYGYDKDGNKVYEKHIDTSVYR